MNRIRKLRIQRNMTQMEVGQALGVGNTAVSMYECGHRKLDDENIRNLCKTICWALRIIRIHIPKKMHAFLPPIIKPIKGIANL